MWPWRNTRCPEKVLLSDYFSNRTYLELSVHIISLYSLFLPTRSLKTPSWYALRVAVLGSLAYEVGAALITARAGIISYTTSRSRRRCGSLGRTGCRAVGERTSGCRSSFVGIRKMSVAKRNERLSMDPEYFQCREK